MRIPTGYSGNICPRALTSRPTRNPSSMRSRADSMSVQEKHSTTKHRLNGSINPLRRSVESAVDCGVERLLSGRYESPENRAIFSEQSEVSRTCCCVLLALLHEAILCRTREFLLRGLSFARRLRGGSGILLAFLHEAALRCAGEFLFGRLRLARIRSVGQVAEKGRAQ